MDQAAEVGVRVRRMRHLNGLGQADLANASGLAQGQISMIENGRVACKPEMLERLAEALGCGPRFLAGVRTPLAPTRPWLRAYADAPQKALDRQLADVSNVVDVIEAADLRRPEVKLPDYLDDLNDYAAIEAFALDVREAAELGRDAVVGNMMRAAEMLGCILVPMGEELGKRHLGMSTRFGVTPFISVSRPSLDPARDVPGDRQRFTVAHELGHLALHAHLDAPATAQDARLIEKQAHRFAASFLAPGDAMLDELEARGGRVTLKTLAGIKLVWGVSIKALVGRYRDIGVIDENQAVSLFKQIASRGYNKAEPVPVGNESAVWLRAALREKTGRLDNSIAQVAELVDLPREQIERWLDWTPTGAEVPHNVATVIAFPSRDGLK